MYAPWQQVYDMNAASYVLHETKLLGGLYNRRSNHSNCKFIYPLCRSEDVTLLPVSAREDNLDITFPG